MRTHVHHNLALVALWLVNVDWPSASASASPSSPTSSFASYSHLESSGRGGGATRKMYDINYQYIQHRQLAPAPALVPTSSSYNWWPYPPQTFVPPTPVTTTDTSPLLLSFDTTSTSFSSTASTASTSSSNSSSSTPTSTSMITLTPRPPQTTSPLPSIKSLPKNDPKAQSKLTYILIPLFALLGVILGSVAAWLVYGCLTRKPKISQAFGIEEKGIAGPRYVPTAGNGLDADVGRDADIENGRYHAMTLGPMMQEVNLDSEEGRPLFGWPGIPSDRGSSVGEHWHREDDPFLLPPTHHKPKTRSSKSTRSVMSNATSLAFLEFYESDEEALDDERRERLAKKRKEEDDIPWESLRHKSIKRGILERVRKEAGWVDSLRGVVGSSFSDFARLADVPDTKAKNVNVKKRHTHVRGDSDLCIEDLVGRASDGVSVPDKVLANSNSPSKSTTRPLLSTVDSAVTTTTITTAKGSTTPSRANSSRTSYSTTSPDGKGFRILSESPLPHPPPLHTHTSHASQSNTSDDGGYWWWGEASADIDRYTAVPARLCRSRSQSRSGSTSPVKGSPMKGSGGGGRTAGRWPFARDVLPQSPPRIMSPMLEDQLLFTPTPGHGHSVPPWGWGTVDVAEVSSPLPMQKSGGAGKGKSGKRLKERGRTLRSPRPPSLPFPRDPDRGLLNSPLSEDVFRGRLVKQSSPSRKTTRDKPLPRQPVIPGVGNGGGDGGAGVEAVERVEKIVKQGWSTRELRLGDGVKSLSPTGFGKMV